MPDIGQVLKTEIQRIARKVTKAQTGDLRKALRAARSGNQTSSAAQHQTRLFVVLGLSTTYLLIEVIGGLLTNSLALLADVKARPRRKWEREGWIEVAARAIPTDGWPMIGKPCQSQPWLPERQRLPIDLLEEADQPFGRHAGCRQADMSA